MLHQYLYISTAPDLSIEDVEAITGSSARKNPTSNITGFLIYNGRNFLQLLEGEPADLNALMRRIGEDPRHTGLSMLYSGQIDRRVCTSWGMKRITISDRIAERQDRLMRELPEGLDEVVEKIVLNFAVLN